MNLDRGLRLVVWIATMLPCLPQLALAAELTLRLPSVEARSGGTVDVPITVGGASGVGAIQLEVIYDPAVISADTVTRGPLAGGNALVDFNPNNPGRLIFGLATLQDISGDGVIATARFKVVGKAGQSSTLAIAKGEAWEGKTHQAMVIRTEAGNLRVIGGVPWWWWLIGALVAAAGLMILLWLLLRRRQTQPQAPAQSQVSDAAVASPPPQRRGPFCSRCGSPNDEGARFCSKCGQRLSQLQHMS